MNDKLKLGLKNKKILSALRLTIFILFILGSLYFAHRLFFPSEYFTQSFENMNSLKNTITDLSSKEDNLVFFASSDQEFSEIRVSVTLQKKSSSLKNTNVDLRKSYKAFFYPTTPEKHIPSTLDENLLISSPNAIYIIGEGKKSPFDNPQTFEGLGYAWENIEPHPVDLSEYEKTKLLNITSAHPENSVLATDTGKYFLISNKEKQILDTKKTPRVKDFKNNILVQEKSLEVTDNCQLEKAFLFKNRYYCTIKIENINNFSGKDYQFKLSDIDNNIKLKNN
jgi:hypothetical protein